LAASPITAQQKLDFKSAYDLGLKNSFDGRAFQLETEASGILARSGNTFSKIAIQSQAGQYNSQLQDQSFSISQNFQLPSVYKNQKKFNQTQFQMARLDELQFRADFWFQLRTEFEKLHHSQNMGKLLSGLDSLAAREMEMAEQRMKAGETGKMELALAKRQMAELKLRIHQAEMDGKAAVQQIALLIRDSLGARFQSDEWKDNPPSATTFPESSLRIMKARANAETEGIRLSLEKSNRLPEFMLGYFNQSLNGIPIDGRLAGSRDRFQGLNIGVQVPLLPSSAGNRVEAARQRMKAAENRVLAEKTDGLRRLKELEFEINSAKGRLELLEGSSLKAAQEVLDAAREQWKAGNASFQEVLLQRKSLLQMQEEVLLIRHKISLLGIQLFYLTNEKWN
jgi:cobalt-zinc-cadmium resistance protein CzcA